MLRPSYSELMDVINKNSNKEVSSEITSRYIIVIAAAKRARQLIDGAEPLVVMKSKVDKPVSIAVQEINQNKLTVKQLHDFDNN